MNTQIFCGVITYPQPPQKSAFKDILKLNRCYAQIVLETKENENDFFHYKKKLRNQLKLQYNMKTLKLPA